MIARTALCAAAAATVLTACSPPAAEAPAAPAPAPAAPAAETPALPPVEPPAPGTPGGLPDDRTPLAEGPIDPKSEQGAGQVLQTYFALLEMGKYAEARRLWGNANDQSDTAFAAGFAKYSEYHAQVGGPGRMEGAAGSLYVEIPVVIYGRLKTGAEVHENGTATLRRVNDVEGATPEQLKWHIVRLDLKPSP